MGNPNDITTLPYLEQRQYRRFNLRYPVHGTYSSANTLSNFDAVSRNVSIGGLLMETTSQIPPHSLVSFTMMLQGEMVVRPMRLAGEGDVVRMERAETGVCFRVAVACRRLIAQQKN